ncbi:MAG: pleD [Solirubrobacterales bacterium]|nr:pleD [Solirubrobacterales bacterium]
MSITPRVLIIDDSELILAAAELGLTHAGWDVRTSSSGEEGLAAGIADPPDVILLDLTMPGMPGTEVLARLRKAPATQAVPIVLLTASPELADGHEADGIVTKPFPPLELAARVRGALGWAP